MTKKEFIIKWQNEIANCEGILQGGKDTTYHDYFRGRGEAISDIIEDIKKLNEGE